MRIIEFAVAAIVVIILGGLAGWFFFLRSQSAATAALDAARGISTFGSAPFGGSAPAGSAITGITGAPAAPVAPPQLWQMSTSPAAGVGFAASTSSSTTLAARFVDRATGYVSSADLATSVVTRLTNTLMPKIYEAAFPGGEHVIERSLDSGGSITTFAGAIAASSTGASSSSLSGEFLARDIETLASDPATGKLFMLVRSTSGGITGIESMWDGSKQTQIFTSSLSDWRPYLLADGRVFIAQSAADSIPGYAYQIVKGNFVPLMPPQPGLVILPRTNSSALLYSTSQDGALSLYVRASATSSPVLLPLHTTAEKCTWVPPTAPTEKSAGDLIAYCAVPETAVSDFLDQWYRGQVHSSDAIWRIDATTGHAALYFTPDAKTPVDVLDPAIDASGSYLAFLNGSDLTPWVLKLVQ